MRTAIPTSFLWQQAKGAAYLDTASQCWYILKTGIAQPEDISPQYGVMVADDIGIEVVRPAPHRVMNLPFATWMSLARGDADRFDRPEQSCFALRLISILWRLHCWTCYPPRHRERVARPCPSCRRPPGLSTFVRCFCGGID